MILVSLYSSLAQSGWWNGFLCALQKTSFSIIVQYRTVRRRSVVTDSEEEIDRIHAFSSSVQL